MKRFSYFSDKTLHFKQAKRYEFLLYALKKKIHSKYMERLNMKRNGYATNHLFRSILVSFTKKKDGTVQREREEDTRK